MSYLFANFSYSENTRLKSFSLQFNSKTLLGNNGLFEICLGEKDSPKRRLVLPHSLFVSLDCFTWHVAKQSHLESHFSFRFPSSVLFDMPLAHPPSRLPDTARDGRHVGLSPLRYNLYSKEANSEWARKKRRFISGTSSSRAHMTSTLPHNTVLFVLQTAVWSMYWIVSCYI